jgi:hypothetical protein
MKWAPHTLNVPEWMMLDPQGMAVLAIPPPRYIPRGWRPSVLLGKQDGPEVGLWNGERYIDASRAHNVSLRVV